MLILNKIGKIYTKGVENITEEDDNIQPFSSSFVTWIGKKVLNVTNYELQLRPGANLLSPKTKFRRILKYKYWGH